MKFDGVDAFPSCIEVMQHGREAIGEAGMLELSARAQFGSCDFKFRRSPGCPLAPNSLLQRRVAREQVVVRQGRRLIENNVSAGAVFHEFDLAPSARAVLDSPVMRSSSSKLSSTPGARMCPGSLALLLLRR